jgi:hypothetical protein
MAQHPPSLLKNPENRLADEGLRIAHRILRYVVENPNAQDTLEGIIEWWLLESLSVSHVARVKEAMVELVSAKLLLECRGKESRTYYRINPDRLKEISAFLGEKN